MKTLPSTPDLQAFLAVCELRGFARAAERLGLSQPAISNRIRSLEATLGTPVFEQPRRRVILTAAGARLLDACRRLVPELEAVTRTAATVGWPSEEPLRLACAGAFGRYVVYPILCEPAFRDVRVVLLFRQPDDILALVESGACELGITYATRVTRTLELREACEEEFVLIAPQGAAPEAGTGIDVLAARDFVTYEECDYVFGRWFDDVFGRQATSIRSASHFERIEEVVGMVALGRGLSIVPAHAVTDAAAERRVEIVREGWGRCINREYAVTRPGRAPRVEATTLLDRLRRVSLHPGTGQRPIAT